MNGFPYGVFSFIADLVCGRDCEEGWIMNWIVVEGCKLGVCYGGLVLDSLCL